MVTAHFRGPLVPHLHQDLALCSFPQPFEVFAALAYFTDETLIIVPQGVPLISDRPDSRFRALLASKVVWIVPSRCPSYCSSLCVSYPASEFHSLKGALRPAAPSGLLFGRAGPRLEKERSHHFESTSRDLWLENECMLIAPTPLGMMRNHRDTSGCRRS